MTNLFLEKDELQLHLPHLPKGRRRLSATGRSCESVALLQDGGGVQAADGADAANHRLLQDV